MPRIVLTEEQARVLTQADEPVELRDEEGHLLARLPIPLEDEIAEARRRLASNQRRWSWEKVQGLLAELEALDKREGVDETKLRDVLARFRAGTAL